MILILAFVLTACSQPAPAPAPTAAPAPTTAAPAPAPNRRSAGPDSRARAHAPEPTTAPEPTAVPPAGSKYKEAPMLADMVTAGTLPPVDERLPMNPYVIEAPEVGQYGGMWHRGFTGPSDRNGLIRVVNDGLVRFSIDGASVEMKYAESVAPNDDFTEWTIKLREGSKWSDGEPFTADDIMFWYNDVVNNKDLSPSIPSWLTEQGRQPGQGGEARRHVREVHLRDPQTLFLQEIAQKDDGDKNIPMFLPAHYLKQFHTSYADKADLDKMVADAGLKTWGELFYLKQDQFDNPDRP